MARRAEGDSGVEKNAAPRLHAGLAGQRGEPLQPAGSVFEGRARLIDRRWVEHGGHEWRGLGMALRDVLQGAPRRIIQRAEPQGTQGLVPNAAMTMPGQSDEQGLVLRSG